MMIRRAVEMLNLAIVGHLHDSDAVAGMGIALVLVYIGFAVTIGLSSAIDTL
jgi:Na+-driven multidrug efflux pump